MERIFTLFLNITIEASWLILAVILIRFLLKSAPKWIRCVMWTMVGLKLAIPFTIESRLSLVPDTQNIAAVTDYVAAENITQSVSVTEIASVIWAIGVTLMLGYMLLSFLLLKRKVNESIPVKDNVMLCDNIASPFVLGFIRPKIYLSSSMTENEKQFVLAHEQAHLKRGDNFWKPLGFLLLSVHWFNPLCWVAYWLFNKDIELACDEKVIKDLDSKGRKAYSTALLVCNSGRYMVTACPVAFGENNVKSRIKSVLSYKKPTVYIMSVAVILCAVVAVGFMTSPETQAKEPEPTVAETTAATEPVTEKVTETQKVTEKATETTAPPTEATTKPVETVAPTTAPQTVATTAPTQATIEATESNRGGLVEIQPFEESEAYKRQMNENIHAYNYSGRSGLSMSVGDTDTRNNVANEPIAWDISP